MLVVEDKLPFGSYLVLIISQSNYSVIETGEGNAVLKLVREEKPATVIHILTLLDMDKIAGLELEEE